MQKRRIYDITNVLEGIGLIEKKLKNRIRWKYVSENFKNLMLFPSILVCCFIRTYEGLVKMIRGLDNSIPGEVDADASILQVSESKNLLCKAATTS